MNLKSKIILDSNYEKYQNLRFYSVSIGSTNFASSFKLLLLLLGSKDYAISIKVCLWEGFSKWKRGYNYSWGHVGAPRMLTTLMARFWNNFGWEVHTQYGTVWPMLLARSVHIKLNYIIWSGKDSRTPCFTVTFFK